MYFEPFCGALGVMHRMTGKRIAADGFKPLITMYKHVQKGWRPPKRITAKQHAWYKANPDPNDPLTAFIGFGCSLFGQLFNTFLRDSFQKGRNIAEITRKSLMKKMDQCQDVRFVYKDYRKHVIKAGAMFIYCDPPYSDMAFDLPQLPGFDHSEFWETMREWTKAGHTVIISGKVAPKDFVSLPTPAIAASTIRTSKMETPEAQTKECLFVHKSDKQTIKKARAFYKEG